MISGYWRLQLSYLTLMAEVQRGCVHRFRCRSASWVRGCPSKRPRKWLWNRRRNIGNRCREHWEVDCARTVHESNMFVRSEF